MIDAALRSGLEKSLAILDAYTLMEARLIIGLLLNDGEPMTRLSVEQMLFGRRRVTSALLPVHIHRINRRNSGYRVCYDRGVGYRLEMQ